MLKGRWVAVKRRRNVFATLSGRTVDHFARTTGSTCSAIERPLPNLNQGAGLDVSPAVRDYLEMGGKDVCDWKFVEARDVPTGPWTK